MIRILMLIPLIRKFYFGTLISRSLKLPLAAWVWQAAQLARLFTRGSFQLFATSRCSDWNQRVSVMRSGGSLPVDDLRCLVLAFFSRKSPISAAAAASRLASLPKCLSRPAIIARHDSRDRKRGGEATVP